MTTDASPTDAPSKLVVRQKILLAAVSLGPAPFRVDVLCARVWDLFPESFSLALPEGRKLPDSNRVLSKLSGSDGLCGRGWLVYQSEKTYCVTRAGYLAAKPLLHHLPIPHEAPPLPEETPPPKRKRTPKQSRVVAPTIVAEAPPTTLTPEELLSLNTLAKCEALRKFLRALPLTFTDACAFWGVSLKRPGDAVVRAGHTGALLVRVVESLHGDGPIDPKLPPLSTCYGLLNLHRLMRTRFAKELDATQATEVTHA
jgi:hypothetical protein